MCLSPDRWRIVLPGRVDAGANEFKVLGANADGAVGDHRDRPDAGRDEGQPATSVCKHQDDTNLAGGRWCRTRPPARLGRGQHEG